MNKTLFLAIVLLPNMAFAMRDQYAVLTRPSQECQITLNFGGTNLSSAI